MAHQIRNLQAKDTDSRSAGNNDVTDVDACDALMKPLCTQSTETHKASSNHDDTCIPSAKTLENKKGPCAEVLMGRRILEQYGILGSPIWCSDNDNDQTCTSMPTFDDDQDIDGSLADVEDGDDEEFVLEDSGDAENHNSLLFPSVSTDQKEGTLMTDSMLPLAPLKHSKSEWIKQPSSAVMGGHHQQCPTLSMITGSASGDERSAELSTTSGMSSDLQSDSSTDNEPSSSQNGSACMRGQPDVRPPLNALHRMRKFAILEHYGVFGAQAGSWY